MQALYTGAAAASAGLPAGERQEETGHGHRQPKHSASIRVLCQIILKGSDQQKNRGVWSNVNTRYLVWRCGDGRSFAL
jgi:hypothetical protein